MFNLSAVGENESAKAATRAFIEARSTKEAERRMDLMLSGLIGLGKAIQELHAEVRRKAKKP